MPHMRRQSVQGFQSVVIRFEPFAIHLLCSFLGGIRHTDAHGGECGLLGAFGAALGDGSSGFL